MFDWLGDIISGIGDVINSTVETLGQKVSNAIFDSLLQWYYESIYNAIADFFAMMGNRVQKYLISLGYKPQSNYLRCLVGRCLLPEWLLLYSMLQSNTKTAEQTLRQPQSIY